MTLLAKFEYVKLTKLEQKSIAGRASEGRCQRMMSRHVSRGGGDTRLWARIKKNC